MTKNRKDNFNIIFNNNTYNLNLVDPNYWFIYVLLWNNNYHFLSISWIFSIYFLI